MIKHALFPILLTEDRYSDHEKFKDVFLNCVYKHFAETDTSLDSGYRQGCLEQYDLHLEPEFQPLYVYLQSTVNDYLKALHVDTSVIDIYTTKSWLNIVKDSRIPYHGHGDAHLSAVYYVNIPVGREKPLRFHNYFERMEPFPGCIKYNNTSDIWDELNAYVWSYMPSEGASIVFPGRMMHDSEEGYDQEFGAIPTFEEFKNFRVSIAVDYTITFNSHQGKAIGLQPINNWRKFDEAYNAPGIR